MDKEGVPCIYNELSLSHKRDRTGSLVEMWMVLETHTE